MQQNDIKMIRTNVGRKIKERFVNRVRAIEIFDIVDESSHWAFKIRFIAYDYFVIVFNYELDIIGFSIEVGNGMYIRLLNEHNCYSDVDMDVYLDKIKKEIEL
jgi:hypothetical protein